MTLGRKSGLVDVVVARSTVSKIHATLTLSARGRVSVASISTKNPVRVNDIVVSSCTPRVLAPGDVLEVVRGVSYMLAGGAEAEEAPRTRRAARARELLDVVAAHTAAPALEAPPPPPRALQRLLGAPVVAHALVVPRGARKNATSSDDTTLRGPHEAVHMSAPVPSGRTLGASVLPVSTPPPPPPPTAVAPQVRVRACPDMSLRRLKVEQTLRLSACSGCTPRFAGCNPFTKARAQRGGPQKRLPQGRHIAAAAACARADDPSSLQWAAAAGADDDDDDEACRDRRVRRGAGREAPSNDHDGRCIQAGAVGAHSSMLHTRK